MSKSTAWHVSQSTQSTRRHLPSPSSTMSELSRMVPASVTMQPSSLLELDARPGRLFESRPVLFQNATVHHYEDSRLARLLGSLLVNHVFLHPDRRDL